MAKGHPVAPGQDLEEAGVDSIVLPKILLHIEAAFGFWMPDEDLVEENAYLCAPHRVPGRPPGERSGHHLAVQPGRAALPEPPWIAGPRPEGIRHPLTARRAVRRGGVRGDGAAAADS